MYDSIYKLCTCIRIYKAIYILCMRIQIYDSIYMLCIFYTVFQVVIMKELNMLYVRTNVRSELACASLSDVYVA